MRVDKRLGKIMVITMIISLLTISIVGMNVVAQNDDEDDTAWSPLGIALGGLCCFILIIPWIIFILIAVWVYKDAEKRGMSGALWLIIVIILGIIGIIIYLIVRRGHPVQQAPPPGYYPPPQQPGYPPQQPPYYPPQQPPQQPGYPPRQP
jgi:predicted permease